MKVPRVRSDALVDGFDRPDGGCSLHPSCRTCPLAQCRYDPGYRVDIVKADLSALIAQRMRSQGASIKELMRELGVCRRSVYRFLNRQVTNSAISRSQQISREGGARAV